MEFETCQLSWLCHAAEGIAMQRQMLSANTHSYSSFNTKRIFGQQALAILENEVKIPTSEGFEFRIKELINVLDELHDPIPTC